MKGNHKHGHTRGRRNTPTYQSWKGLFDRCYRPAFRYYADYGGRGITVCDRWRDFRNFLDDMGERPPDHSIDRIDNDGNYEPGNCRWATRAEQCRNRRSNIFIEHDGERLCVADWERKAGLNPTVLLNRLRRGWSLAEAISPTFQRRKGYKICRPRRSSSASI